jgi:hypothetical protein
VVTTYRVEHAITASWHGASLGPVICDATPDNFADVSKDSCSFLHMDSIIQLVNNEEWVQLDSLYQAPFWNPFFEVDYGANPYGIFLAACPPDCL